MTVLTIFEKNRKMKLFGVSFFRTCTKTLSSIHRRPKLDVLITASFDTALHITKDLKILYEKFNIVVNQKCRHKNRNKLFSRKLGPVVALSV